MAARPARKLPDPNAPNDPAVEAALQAVPETMVAEILDGEFHTMARPARLHTMSASMLGAGCTTRSGAEAVGQVGG